MRRVVIPFYFNKSENDMKKYFYAEGEQKHGPFSFDELKEKDINKETMIWFEGLNDWTPAKEIKEVKSILELNPPPIPSDEIDQNVEVQGIKTDTINFSESTSKSKSKQSMFSKSFSFEGRIRRTEYGISFIVVVIINTFLNAIVETGQAPMVGLAYIPTLWFLWAQGAKRCHDMGNSGWFQIIPFYVFWMIFASGDDGTNEYGTNPKK